MLKFEEYKAILDEGRELLKEVNHPTLKIELKLLNQEFQKLKNSRGINKDIAESGCAYYANQVQNSIHLILA